MRPFHNRLSLIPLLWVAALFTPAAGAAPGVPTLATEVRTTQSAQAVRGPIQKFLTDNLANLTNPDAIAQKQARDAIITEAQPAPAGSAQPTPEFLRAYSEVLADLVTEKQLVKSPDPRVRLSVAVITSKVAERSSSTKLMPIVVSLLNDDSEAIVLVAVKAAKPLVVPALSVGPAAKNNPLTPAIVAAAKKYGTNGAITQTAYDALKIDWALPTMAGTAQSIAVPIAVAATQDLLSQRIIQYNQNIPDLAFAENLPINFLITGDVWRKESPAQQVQSVQLISDLIGVVGQRVGDSKISLSEKTDLTELLKRGAEGLLVVVKTIGGSSAIDKPANSLRTVTKSMTGEELHNRADQIYPALTQVAQFKTLKAPPKLQ